MARKRTITQAIIIITTVLLVGICTCLVTQKVIRTEMVIGSNGFTGTYSLENRPDTSLDDEYLVMDINAEYFMIYNASDEIQVEGKCGLDQENFAYIKNERGSIIGHAVYSNKQYYLLLNEEKGMQLNKISEDPIIPEISNRES